MTKKKKIVIGVLTLIVIALMIALYIYVVTWKPTWLLNKNSNQNDGLPPDVISKKATTEALDKSNKVKKKYKGKEGDNIPPSVKVAILPAILDLEKKQYVKATVEADDPSGIFRVRIKFFHRDKLIGYMQQNPNTKKGTVKVDFELNNKVVIDDMKTFFDYEGAKMTYKVQVWDNNENMKEVLGGQIEIVDNIPPEKMKANWVLNYKDENNVEVFTNKLKTKFLLYSVADLPTLPENKVVKYEYGYTSAAGQLLLKVGLEPFVEPRKEIEIEAISEGRFVFFARAYDLKGNISEKKIKFGVDIVPPVGVIEINEGIEFHVGEPASVTINGQDNLSGVARYRIGMTQEEVLGVAWQDFKTSSVPIRVSNEEGLHEVWAQLEDKALNQSKPFQAYYIAKIKTTIEVTGKVGERERVLQMDKDSVNKGDTRIKNMKER